MEKSLKEFKSRFIDLLLEVMWRQWTALGIASHVEPEDKWLIDPEALLFGVFFVRDRDKRLFEAVEKWFYKNHTLISTARMKKIEKSICNRASMHNFIRKWEDAKYIRLYYTHVISTQRENKVKEILAPVSLLHPPVLRLRLREMLGQNPRVEILIYFLYHETGNSLSIAKEVFLDQKSVYNVLEAWVKVGMLEKVGGKKKGYRINSEARKTWLKILGLNRLPSYLNWGRLYISLSIILKALETPPWNKDVYLLSSLFRDVYGEIKETAGKISTPPSPELYQGEEFFEPFSRYLIGLLEGIVGKKKKRGKI
ncbi:hypothetical protein DRQ20_05045 [bacterium]|nr:MAG: hypothetical protein DRQ20_05045 [bacterium]